MPLLNVKFLWAKRRSAVKSQKQTVFEKGMHCAEGKSYLPIPVYWVCDIKDDKISKM